MTVAPRLILFAALLATVAHAKTINLAEPPYSAAGDGIADIRPILNRAFGDAKHGDILLVPQGRHRVVLTGGPLAIPEGVTLGGEDGRPCLLLTSNGKSGDYREFLRPMSNVTVEGLTIQRDSDFSGILLPISGDATNITFRNCLIIGAQTRFPKQDCHGFRVGYGSVKNLTFDNITVEDCCYGLFQPNDATGILDGVLVANSHYSRNTASDLEFNSPKGAMKNITVRNCSFRDNRSMTAGGGFAVGFANVTNGLVENCQIENYGSEAIHVEDRSTNIRLTGNSITNSSYRQNNGVILVVNDSRQIFIEGNVVDARQNTNNAHLVLVTAGGKLFPNPSGVVVRDNTLFNGPATRTWYLQPGSGPLPTGNLVFPAESPTKP